MERLHPLAGKRMNEDGGRVRQRQNEQGHLRWLSRQRDRRFSSYWPHLLTSPRSRDKRWPCTPTDATTTSPWSETFTMHRQSGEGEPAPQESRPENMNPKKTAPNRPANNPRQRLSRKNRKHLLGFRTPNNCDILTLTELCAHAKARPQGLPDPPSPQRDQWD